MDRRRFHYKRDLFNLLPLSKHKEPTSEALSHRRCMISSHTVRYTIYILFFVTSLSYVVSQDICIYTFITLFFFFRYTNFHIHLNKFLQNDHKNCFNDIYFNFIDTNKRTLSKITTNRKTCEARYSICIFLLLFG